MESEEISGLKISFSIYKSLVFMIENGVALSEKAILLLYIPK